MEFQVSYQAGDSESQEVIWKKQRSAWVWCDCTSGSKDRNGATMQRIDSGWWKQNAAALEARREAQFLQSSLEFEPSPNNSANTIEQQLEAHTSICVSYK